MQTVTGSVQVMRPGTDYYSEYVWIETPIDEVKYQLKQLKGHVFWRWTTPVNEVDGMIVVYYGDDMWEPSFYSDFAEFRHCLVGGFETDPKYVEEEVIEEESFMKRMLNYIFD